jgi:cation diffusion facilitator CzcD-associated flavoprotein CzcO
MRIAIIGAGCSGITAVKNHVELGFTEVVCYEQSGRIGGNWVYTADTGHSSVMENTFMISSKKMSEFLDFPMPDDFPDYPSHQQVLQYFESYCTHFGIYPYIRFHSKVDKAILNPEGKWAVYSNSSEVPEIFDYLLVANGHHSVPRHYKIPGHFSGEYMHSHDFKNNKGFENKRVLVIGGGNSACDVAVECSRVAAKTVISMRRPHYIIPKFFMGKPTDTFNDTMRYLPDVVAEKLRKLSLKIQVGNYEDYGLKNPDFPVTYDHPTVNSELLYLLRHGRVKATVGIREAEGKTVVFEDGTTDDFDVIVAATGYKIATPFFDPDFLDYSEAESIELYLRMFHPDYPSLIFIGLVQPQGAIWPLSDIQSRLAAKYIKGEWKLPENLRSLAKKEAEDIRRSFLPEKRHTIEVHYIPYLQKLAKLAGYRQK